MIVYIIGSLRNPEIPAIANKIQAAGHEAFADWYGAGSEADDKWKEYEIERGNTYLQALTSYGAQAVFNFDKRHLERAEAVVLVAPAGKSGHLELGWSLGKGKKGYYLLDNPDRWDVMLQFATLVTDKLEDIIEDMAIDRSILYVCEVCHKPIKAGMAMTNFKAGEAHYECWENYILNAESIQQTPQGFPCGCNICRPT